MKKIITFLMECYYELKKVNWPSRDDVVAQTIVVVVSLVVVSALLAVMDYASFKLIESIISLGR